MRLSECDIEISNELVQEIMSYFPTVEFRDYFPANFEGLSDDYAFLVLVDRDYKHYPISVKTDVESIPVSLWEYDRALYHYENNFKINFDIGLVGNHIERSIKKEAERAVSRVASKRTRREQKAQTNAENRKFNRFLPEVISSFREYVTQEIISTLNNDEELKRFVTWQILSGIPHFNYKLPSAKWLFTNSGMYDISTPDTPYVVTAADQSTITAIETPDGIKDRQKGRPFTYNNAIERLMNEEVSLYPSKRFFEKITEIRARVMQLSKRMDVSIFEALSFTSVGVTGEIVIL